MGLYRDQDLAAAPETNVDYFNHNMTTRGAQGAWVQTPTSLLAGRTGLPVIQAIGE